MSRTIEVSDETYEKIKDQLQDDDAEIEDWSDLVGGVYCFQCARYVYHGQVEYVSAGFVRLANAGIVYETGALDAKAATDRQPLPNGALVLRSSIESIFRLEW